MNVFKNYIISDNISKYINENLDKLMETTGIRKKYIICIKNKEEYRSFLAYSGKLFLAYMDTEEYLYPCFSISINDFHYPERNKNRKGYFYTGESEISRLIDMDDTERPFVFDTSSEAGVYAKYILEYKEDEFEVCEVYTMKNDNEDKYLHIKGGL